MKKLLLTTAACGLVLAATPAAADGVELEIGGYLKSYGAFINQEEGADDSNTPPAAGALTDESAEVNDFDLITETEIHLTGETTLDNGLTVGAHFEFEADGGNNTNDSFEVEESYVYFSGGWGRVNVGNEDGAAYLLQVAAPSADSNVDGIRQYIQPVNYVALTQSGTDLGVLDGTSEDLRNLNGAGSVFIDYDQNITGYDDKITYLSPIMNGFQLGLTYAPDTGNADDNGAGVRTTDVEDAFGAGYEGALRYEGQFNNIGVTAGLGFSHVELEKAAFVGLTTDVPVNTTTIDQGDASDDRSAWNAGLDLDIGAFGIGAIYKEDDAGKPVLDVATATENAVIGSDEETWVVGIDYTTGPFKLGASYLDQENTFGVTGLETQRYSGGVTYTYGPGLTFRGSIGYIEHDGDGIGGTADGSAAAGAGNVDSVDATYVLLGTQINF